jgi:TP901 family phage tail tape measure protein
MSEETIKLSIQTPAVDDGGLKTIRAYVQSLDRFHKLAEKPIVIRVETQGVERARQALEMAQKAGAKAMKLPASVPSAPSTYLSSLQTHLTAVSRYAADFHVTIAKLKAGFKTPEQKVNFLTGVEEQISRATTTAKKFSFHTPADREGFIDSLKSASNMVKLETEAMHAVQVEAMKSKQDAALFQAPEDRKGAARGKTDALAASDKSLAAATSEAKHGIVEQDRALLAKIQTLHKTTVATDALSRSEKHLATSAGASASAERGALIKRVERDGTLKSRTYAVSPGVTQTIAPGATGDSTTVTTDRMAELKSRVKETNEEFSRLVTKRKAEGAGTREISAIYSQQAHALDKLAGEYSAIEAATGHMIARQAEAARVKSGATSAAASRKAEAESEKRSLKDGVDFRKRMEEAKWTEIQRIEDRAKAAIASKRASGGRPSEITKLHETAAKEIEAVSRGFRSSEDRNEAGRRSTGFRNAGRIAQIQADAAAEQKVLAQAARDNKAFRQRIQMAASQQLATDTVTDVSARGFKEAGRRTMRTGSGSREVIDFTKENGSLRENVRLMVERDAKGRILNATSAEGSQAITKTADATGYLTKNFLQNTATVAVWAASVGALYGSLAILRHGLESAVSYDRKFAALTVVFRGTETQAAQLRDEVLMLAAAYGQSGDEALDAAIRFSRLGMSQAQTLEAVRAALMAANVAEMGVGEAANALSAIMATFHLQAKDLVGVINRLNAVSNTYNVTNKDMLNGLARVGSVARTSGLSLAETMGTIAAVVARTGRSGAEAGNALKTIIVGFSNPTKQNTLADMFKFSVTDQTGELKAMSDVLRELFLRYQELTGAEQQHMLQVVAGKQQASRLAAMIDGYVDSQLMAIRSVTDLDSAERENARIKQSLLVQVQSLATAYERLVYNLSNSGGDAAILGTLREMTKFLKNVITLMGTYSDATAIVMGMTALFAARMGVTAIRLAEAGKQFGFVTNTGKALAHGLGTLQTTLATMNRELIYSGSRTLKFTQEMMGATGAVRGLGVAFAWTAGAMKAFLAATAIGLALYGVMLLVNKIAEDAGSQWEKSAQKLAGFNKELEDLISLSEGARKSQDLARTILTRLRTGKISPLEVEKYIEVGAELLSGGDTSKQSSAEAELKSAYLLSGQAGLQVRYEQMLVTSKKEGLKIDAEKAKVEADELKEARKALTDAKKELYANPGSADLKKNFRAAEISYRAASNKSGKSALHGDESDSTSEEDNAAELRQRKTKDRLEKMTEARLKAVASVQEAFTTLSPADKTAMEIASIDAQIQELKKLQEAKEAQAKSDIAAAESAVTDAAATRDQAKASLESSAEYLRTLKQISDLNDKLAENNASLAATPKYDPLEDRPLLRESREIPTTRGYQDFLKTSIETEAKLNSLKTERNRLEKENPDIVTSEKSVNDAKAALDTITSTMQNKLQIQNEINRTHLEELDITRQQLMEEMKKAEVLKAIQTGRRQGEMATIPLQYGNETQRILRERRVLTNPAAMRDKDTGLPMNINAAKQDFDKAGMLGDQVGHARALEQMKVMGLRVQEQEFSLLQRKLTIEAAIHEEARKTNQERSRSLLMGDRESQLRAAMAAKLGKQKGGFKAEDFMFLSPETKQSISQTNPELLPPEMRTEYQQLQEELKTSTAGLSEFASTLEAVTKAMEDLQNLRLQEKQGTDASQNVDPSSMVASINSSGSAAATAIKQIGDATYDQLMKIASVANANAFKIRSMSLGDAAGNAQAAARGA